eukprot:TRINITY_DN21929_c0_g1_i2.p2 TRINITY_DN21929_c0_g1~~TRINITY_DN21929_c0_g1_i2.p2  ORF type:complete len:211 (+),score=34.67 TRINITY_DN21929_c0_g1_i2:593-1225(+)
MQQRAVYRQGVGKHVSVYAGCVLAAKRALGHAGFVVVAKTVGSEKEAEELQSGNTVISYEHRFVAAVRNQSADSHAEGTTRMDMFGYEIKCDATNQSNIDKEKVHVRIVRTTTFNVSGIRVAATVTVDGNPTIGMDSLGAKATYAKVALDMQTVRMGNTAELYTMLRSGLDSIGLRFGQSVCDNAMQASWVRTTSRYTHSAQTLDQRTPA